MVGQLVLQRDGPARADEGGATRGPADRQRGAAGERAAQQAEVSAADAGGVASGVAPSSDAAAPATSTGSATAPATSAGRRDGHAAEQLGGRR